MKILVCPNNHHFVNKEKCPHCGEKSVRTIEAQKKDCIACGLLCPEYAYGCNIPNESKSNDDFIIT